LKSGLRVLIWQRSIDCIRVLIGVVTIYCPILYHFRYKTTWAIFSYPLHSTPQQRGPRHNIAETRMVWLGLHQKVKKFENMFTCIDTIHKRDRHPDGQTDGRTCIGRVYAYRGAAKKMKVWLTLLPQPPKHL